MPPEVQFDRAQADHLLPAQHQVRSAEATGPCPDLPCRTCSMTATQTDTRPPQAGAISIADLDRDVFDAEQDSHLDADTLEAALTSLLALYPAAPVAAHTAEGVMVAMPDSIPLRQ